MVVKEVKPREKKPWPAYVSSFLLNDMTGACKRRGLTIANCGVSPQEISYLLQLNYEDHIDRKLARESLNYMLDQAEEVKDIIDYIMEKMKNEKEPINTNQ